MGHVIVYSGEGTSPRALQKLIDALHLFFSYRIKTVDHHFFLSSGWESETDLVAFPGGRDAPYHQMLQGLGNARIRSYVEQGGRFMGFCAGGYYGSSFIEFEKGGELEILGSRELAFFPGKAIGPTYGQGTYRYGSDQGSRATLVAWEGGISSVYFDGGCAFEKADSYPYIEVIGSYHDLPGKPAAVVYCPVSLGAALLSGVHPEYSPKDPFWTYLINKILT